ncbi:MAG: PilZ domain-containing protein [Terriglobales bacterium]
MSDNKQSLAGAADWTKLLMDSELIPHLGKLLQAYRDAPPEKREEILLETLLKIKGTPEKANEAAAEVRAHEVPVQPAKSESSATPPFEPELFTSTRGEDRRQHPRKKCFVAVELRVEGSQTPLWGNLSNSSMGGCFVETTASIASGSKLEIGLWVATGKIWIKGLVLNGIVTRTNPSVGARVRFDDLDGKARETLRQFMKFVDNTNQDYQAEQGYLAQLKR